MSEDIQRPDPDSLLERVQRAEAKRHRGRLKIFFGASAGVGKTFGMLLAARERRAEGLDVVAGYVETHKRAETEQLLEGLEKLAPRLVDYRGAQLREFDLDAALKRRPALILVDELAHSNAPGSRHPKRWQDVDELLEAGVDVYTAINVQHIESLNDVVSQITGIPVWETVPDAVLEGADEIELIDLPPDELLQRLKEGKVYLPQQAERAAQNFFRKGNLIALRELALRRTADRVDAQMRDYRDDHAIQNVWQVKERMLVCIGPGGNAENLVRAAYRLSQLLKAEWIVVYIETAKLQHLSRAQRDAILRTLKLAEELGAETVTLNGHRLSDEVIAYARARNATRIVLGKPTYAGLRRWLHGSLVDTIVRQASDIDIHVVGKESDALSQLRENPYFSRSRLYLGLAAEEQKPLFRWRIEYLWAAVVSAICTAAAWPMYNHFDLANLIMVYLLGVVVVAARYGRGPSLLTSFLGVVLFDFFFVPPRFSFAVSDSQYLITFGVMLLVALVISSMTVSIKHQARVASMRERRSASLYAMSRELAATRGQENIVRVAVRHVADVFETQVVVLLPDAGGRLLYPDEEGLAESCHGSDLSVAQWVYDHGQMAGAGTDTLPGGDMIYLPLRASAEVLGVLVLLPLNSARLALPEQQRLLETFVSQIALALERVRLAAEAQSAQLKIETEQLRNSLLSAISHDLRTPLAAIVGASSSLVRDSERLDDVARRELGQAIYDEATRMASLANNLLDMARLQAGAIVLNRQWQPLEEVVGAALAGMNQRLANHTVSVRLTHDLPLVEIDSLLIERVFANLLDNAVKYTPPGTPIEIGATAAAGELTVTVSDRGGGIPEGEEKLIFEKFHRVASEGNQGGAGLGLSICRSIIEAHGGRIWAENLSTGGAAFHFTLPLSEPPSIEHEENA
ncbi:sensor protein KdpD [mine drainage metagenome]|uniref:histidine kinase n=1 Tax=mine drainage metagenome TaxID=410659 RepID=A0A1J5THM1_9ZZZZ